MLMLAGLGLSGSTLLAWSAPDDGESSLWEITAGVDVVVAALGCAAAVLAVVELVRGGCRAFLVAAASAAGLAAGCSVGEFVNTAALFSHPGPPLALGCALVLLTGAAASVRKGRRQTVPSGRVLVSGRIALLAAAVATPAVPLAAGIGGDSLYEQSSVVDDALVVLSAVVLVAVLLLPRSGPMTWAAIIGGAGLTALAYATGLELLLAEQDALYDSDGAGLMLAFAAAPLAALGTVLLAAAADEATYGAAPTARPRSPTAVSRPR